MGHTHGTTYRDAIREYAEDRIALVCEGTWSGGPMSRDAVLAIAEECLPAHQAYAPDLYEEWQGLAAATGLTMAELVVVGGFTDFVDVVYKRYQQTAAKTHIDDCTSFIVPDSAADGMGFFGQTWDMHASAEPYVILLDVQPIDGPRSLIFTTTGCLGQIGMNEHGVCIGINNLSGAAGQVGVTWNFVVRKALMQTNADDALACLTEAKLAGAHNYLIFDASGCGYNVEAMAADMHIEKLDATPIVHTNHCVIPAMLELQQVRSAERMVSTTNRLNDGNRWLETRPITADHLIALTRDESAICQRGDDAFHILSCGAAIMRPQTNEMWAVWGVPADYEYQKFDVTPVP